MRSIGNRILPQDPATGHRVSAVSPFTGKKQKKNTTRFSHNGGEETKEKSSSSKSST